MRTKLRIRVNCCHLILDCNVLLFLNLIFFLLTFVLIEFRFISNNTQNSVYTNFFFYSCLRVIYFYYNTLCSIRCFEYFEILEKIQVILKDSRYEVSSRVEDSVIQTLYPGKEKYMEGLAGTILLEDTRGFHAGTPLQQGYRQLVQWEFAISNYR